MSASQVQTVSKQISSGTSVSVTLSGVGAGNHLNATVMALNATSLTTSSPSATWTNAIADFTDGQVVHYRNDYTENVASGSWTVTGNQSPAGDINICVSESSGVATSSSLGATNHATGTTSTLQPGSITPASGSVVYTGMSSDGGGTAAGTITDATDTYTVAEAGGAGTVWDESFIAGGTAYANNVAASATNPTWTTHANSPTHIGAFIVEYKAAVAAVAKVPYQPWYWRAPFLAT